ncbi:MAG: hypothetical protein FWE98_01105 [Oscillospiraceae bacterium]|nr:hypothetical protein [Oscillospiraceae bacterium]
MIGTIFFPLSRVITAIIVFCTTLLGGGGLAAALGNAPPSLDPLPYPAWTHQHWIYENEGDDESVREFLYGFLDRGIPVGAVILDRPWELNDVGTYIADPERYDLETLVEEFHGRDVRLLVWSSCMVNESAGEIHAYAKDKGYFLNDGKVIKWWGGNGSMIDYTNPEAVEFWEGQLDKVLEMGIDGFKLDGADPYVMLMLPAYGKGGLIGWKQYQKLQYEHFYYYTKSYGADRVILTRATDDVVGWGLPLRFMSRDINFSGWTGDRDSDWGGIRQALNTMFTSALFNYASYGSEIGGFRGPSEPVKDIFIRWTQLGAFSPVMLNGGGGVYHRPWLYDEETVDVYRQFTKLHYRLIPYIQSQVAYSYELRQPTMRPAFGYYQYMLGDDIFVAPIVEEGNERKIIFPAGEWIYMFDESKVYSGIQTLEFPMDEFPAFIRKGAIIPMGPESLDIENDFTTVHVYPVKGSQSFGLYEDGRKGSTLSYTKTDDLLLLESSASYRPLLWRVYGAAEPKEVWLGDEALKKADSLAKLKAMDRGYCFEGGILWVAVKIDSANAGTEVYVR